LSDLRSQLRIGSRPARRLVAAVAILRERRALQLVPFRSDPAADHVVQHGEVLAVSGGSIHLTKVTDLPPPQ